MIYEKIRKLYEAGQTIDEIANHPKKWVETPSL